MLRPESTKAAQQSQSSIKSFFQPKSPSYASPPSQRSASDPSSVPAAPPLPPPTATPAPPLTRPQSPPRRITNSAPQPSISTTHPQAKISSVREEHVQPLRRINSLLLPINYPDNFYHKITDPTTNPNFSRVLLWTDTHSTSNPKPETKVIGGIVCRLELDPATQRCDIYIQSLALLSPYRRFGLATTLLDEIVKYSVEQKKEPCRIVSLYAHVWTDNEDALKWYGARGFNREGEVIHGYYRRLTPDSAIILRRTIKPSDHLANTTTEPRSSSSGMLTRPNALSTTSRAVSYQQKGPDREWNDLPEDILVPSRSGSARPSPNGSMASLVGAGTIANTPVASVKGKKKRVYPAAAFGAS